MRVSRSTDSESTEGRCSLGYRGQMVMRVSRADDREGIEGR